MAIEDWADEVAIDAPRRGAEAVAACQRRSAGSRGKATALPDACDLPSIFFVGPPRTATTWLHSILQDRMSLPRLKETYFFDQHYARGFAWYLSHFDDAPRHLARAEMAPSYFFSEDARRRISAAAAGVKIVVTLRDPVERLYSLYKMRYSNVVFSWSFEEACAHDREFIATAQYAPHLDAWQRRFGIDNVLIALYEDMPADPQAWLDRICDFIGVERLRLRAGQLAPVHSSKPTVIPKHPLLTRLAVSVGDRIHAHEWEGAIALIKRLRLRRFFLERGRPFPSLDPVVERRLRQKLLADIEATERILGRDLSMWKPPAADEYALKESSSDFRALCAS